MRHSNQIPHSDLNFHKAFTYNHNLSLLENAENAVFTDTINLHNSSGRVAEKVILILYLAISPGEEDVDVIECTHNYNMHVYPNGIILLSFEDVFLQPNDSIDFTYRIRTGKTRINKDKLIRQNYLIFCF
ncbi:MAG: hypothetical protein ACQES1_03960 [Bacteroidota bacterium]